jgi:hypothetical protein
VNTATGKQVSRREISLCRKRLRRERASRNQECAHGTARAPLIHGAPMKKMLTLVFVASALLGACKKEDSCAQVLKLLGEKEALAAYREQGVRDLGAAK